MHVICLLLTPTTIAKLYLQTLSGLANFGRIEGNLDKIMAAKKPCELVKLIAETNITVDKELMVKDIMRHSVARSEEHTSELQSH